MKRGKKLLTLALVLLVLCGGTLLASRLTVDLDTQEEAVSTTTVFTLDADTVTSLAWEYSEDLAFDKEGDSWVYRENSKFPVDSSYLETIFTTLSSVDSYKTIENIENWDTYGLEIPVCSITVTAGQTYQLAIGIETTMGSQRYFSTGDGKVYLVDNTILEPFQYGLYDLMEAQQMPQVEQVTAMTVTTPEGSYTLTYDPDSGRTYSDDYVWFMGDEALDTTQAEAMVGVVTQLSLGQCENYDAQDLSQYGLDTPELSATVWDGGKEAYTLTISAPADGSCYALLPGTDMVFRIDDAISETLRYTTAADLRPTDVLRMDWDTVTALTLTLDGQDYTFTQTQKETTDEEGNTVTENVWLRSGEEVALSQWLSSVTGLSSTGSARGLTPEGEPLLRLQIARERDTFAMVELAFYSYSSDTCLVTLDSTATVTVSRQNVAELLETARDLLES